MITGLPEFAAEELCWFAASVLDDPRIVFVRVGKFSDHGSSVIFDVVKDQGKHRNTFVEMYYLTLGGGILMPSQFWIVHNPDRSHRLPGDGKGPDNCALLKSIGGYETCLIPARERYLETMWEVMKSRRNAEEHFDGLRQQIAASPIYGELAAIGLYKTSKNVQRLSEFEPLFNPALR